MTLYSMYKEIVYHSNGARMAEKHIEAQIEWSNCCMKVANIPKAIQMLESVQKQIKVGRINASFNKRTIHFVVSLL